MWKFHDACQSLSFFVIAFGVLQRVFSHHDASINQHANRDRYPTSDMILVEMSA